MALADQVLETMRIAGKPLKTSEVCDLSGLDKKNVEKAMKELKNNGLIESPKRCFWQPTN